MATTAPIIDLKEYAASGPGLRVDAEKGILYHVKVIGRLSANGREYPPATQQKALGLLEGAKVNIDHPLKANEATPVSSRYGVLRNLAPEGDGTFGNLHYNPKHPLAESILWWAQNEPSAIGLSINAQGRVVRKGGKNIVEEITAVHSVDLVSDPATTKGLHEHKEPRMKTTVRKLLEKIFAGKPKKLKKLREDFPPEIAAVPMDADDAAATDGDDADPEEQLIAAFKAMVNAVLDDDSLDLAGKVDKIQQILQAQEDLLADDSDGTSGGSSAGNAADTGTSEGAKRSAPAQGSGVNELREELAVRDLVEDAGLHFKTTAARRAFVRSLIPLTESDRKAMIDERKELQPAEGGALGGNAPPPPRSAGAPVREGQGNGGEQMAFKENKNRVQFLRTGRRG
jgi:hypothetical protein